MAAGHHQMQRGKLEILAIEQAGIRVRLDMVDADQRYLQGEGQRLGDGQADQDRAQQTRPVGHRDPIQIAQFHRRFPGGLAD